MKQIAAALTALALLGGGIAHAADPPRAPVAHPLKKMSLKACNKLADERSLTGKERADYIKECRSHNAPVTPR